MCGILRLSSLSKLVLDILSAEVNEFQARLGVEVYVHITVRVYFTYTPGYLAHVIHRDMQFLVYQYLENK
ncbi:unnamed protein product [Mesocestoides corti]|uniref:Dynein light chain n=1 Tax=Mesocestoides corti TaxID=53468 RepID=A0A0R3UQT9_MESCO|nr:unnamed protein product [Mesocestoides corti]